MQFDDLQDFRKSNPLFAELCDLALKYRTEIRKFENLERAFENNSSKSTIDLGAYLKKLAITSNWLQMSVLNPVKRETENFIRRVCSTLREKEDPEKTSQNEARHTFYEFKLIPELSAIISSAVIEAVLSTDGGDVNGTIFARVVNELDTLWGEISTKIINGERKALQFDQTSLKKLAAFTLKLVQMSENGRGGPAIHATASSEFAGIAHIFHRVANDAWYTTSRIPSSDLLLINNSTKIRVEVEKRLVDWVIHHGKSFYHALIVDSERIDEILSKSEFSEEWHGLIVHDLATDPSTDALLTPPSYIGSFQSPTGRAYACSTPTTSTSAFRVIGVVRVLFCVRNLICNGFFEIGKFDSEYAKTLVNIEKQHILYKSSDVFAKMLLLCQDSGLRTNAQKIDEFIQFEKVLKNGCAFENQATAASAVCALPSSSSSTAIPTSRSAHRGVDFLIKPNAKLKTIDFRPSRVQRSSILEYSIVFSIAEMLNDLLSSRRAACCEIAAIGIANSKIVDNVATNIHKIQDVKGSSTSRVFENGVLNRVALTQIVSSTVRRIIKSGSEAAAIAQKAGVEDAIAWGSSYIQNKINGELILHVGLNFSDPACYVFLDTCVRVKTLLDESWPLPLGMTWAKNTPRRGKRNPKMESTSDDCETSSTIETTKISSS